MIKPSLDLCGSSGGAVCSMIESSAATNVCAQAPL
jgi:hypothetical protein